MGRLYFLVGLARSGKSSLARSWENYKIDICANNKLTSMVLKDTPRVVVCADWIRLAMHGQVFAQEAEELVHATKNMMARMYFNNGYDVLVDGTHTTDKSIKDLLRIDKNAIFYLCDTTVAECKKRAIMSGQEYLIERNVIDRMDKQLAPWRNDAVAYINKLRSEI